MNYLSWPTVVPDRIIEEICRDHELQFSDAVERKLEFWQQRGVTDPYELAQLRQDYINEHLEAAQRLLDKCVEAVPAYLAKHGVSDDEFIQTWACMGGIWNTVEFERIRLIVRIQQKYPVLEQIARLVGRIADDEGGQRAKVASSRGYSVHHSAPSDIEGITVGNDLTSLLPSEMAQMVDTELDGLFAYKFATRRLQTFQYKSQVTGPSRRVQIRRARQKGPMIVCLDTSSSMSGDPERIGLSLIIRLLQLALSQGRPLMLITFAVFAHPIDVRKDRARLLEFVRKSDGGDTDAEMMLQQVFRLVGSSAEYQNADVLVISDFIIDKVADATVQQLQQLQEEGTRFYGLQVGIADASVWNKYLDRLWQIQYRLTIRPSFIMK